MRVSIITVCFNAAGTIRTAIESVLRQSWKDVEYLVIDGGSTDGTVDALREYEPRFQERMRWISEPDRGMYDAINKGIRMATGDVVGILNADDFFETNHTLGDVVHAFEQGVEIQAIYGDIRFVSQNDTMSITPFSNVAPVVTPCDALSSLRVLPTRRYYSAKHWRSWMLQWGFMPPHPSVYIRRELFAKLGGYKVDYKIAADYELLIRFLRKARLKTVYLNECTVGMRTGGKSTRGWRSNLLLNQEIVRGNRENGYRCWLGMMLPKYFFKVWEFFPKKGCKGRNEVVK